MRAYLCRNRSRTQSPALQPRVLPLEILQPCAQRTHGTLARRCANLAHPNLRGMSSTPSKVTLEVPIDSVEAARLAAPLATRLEVCHDLSSEGWTPKMNLVRECRELVDGTPCTVVAMIRPEFAGCSRALGKMTPAAFAAACAAVPPLRLASLACAAASPRTQGATTMHQLS